MTRDRINYSHGDTGSKPSDGNEFASGERPDAQTFDWFWNRVTNVVNTVWDEFDRLDSDDDGIVDEADTANLYKGNDIDSNGDGVVNIAEDSNNLNGKSDEYLVPSGGIVMWSGAIADIPSGWTLCDGTDGAPDLTDRFVVGAGGSYSPDETGGLDSVTLTESEMPSHDHPITDPGHSHSTPEDYLTSGGGSDHYAVSSNSSELINGTDSSTTGISVDNAGGDSAHENRPPYYALAFIMKT